MSMMLKIQITKEKIHYKLEFLFKEVFNKY